MAITIREIEQRSTYIYVRLNRAPRDTMTGLLKWCAAHECGKVVNAYALSFKDDAELTMFRLKWC